MSTPHSHLDPSDSDLGSFRSQEISPRTPVGLSTSPDTVQAQVPSPTHPFTTTAPTPHLTPAEELPQALPLPAFASSPPGSPDAPTLPASSLPPQSPAASTRTVPWGGDATFPMPPVRPATKAVPAAPPSATRQSWIQRVKGAAGPGPGNSSSGGLPMSPTGNPPALPKQEASAGTYGLTSENSDTVSLLPVASGPFMKSDTLPPSFTSRVQGDMSISVSSPKSPSSVIFSAPPSKVQPRGNTPTIVAKPPAVSAQSNAPTKEEEDIAAAEVALRASPHPRHSQRTNSGPTASAAAPSSEEDDMDMQEGPVHLPHFQRVSLVPDTAQSSSTPMPAATTTTTTTTSTNGSRMLHPQKGQASERAAQTTSNVSAFPSRTSEIFEANTTTNVTSACTSFGDVRERAPFHVGGNRSPADYVSNAASTPMDPHSPMVHFVQTGSGWDSSRQATPVVGSANVTPPSGQLPPWHNAGDSLQIEVPFGMQTPPVQPIADIGTPLAISGAGSPMGMPLPYFSAGAGRAHVPTSRVRRRQRSSAIERSLSMAEYDGSRPGSQHPTPGSSATPLPLSARHQGTPRTPQAGGPSIWLSGGHGRQDSGQGSALITHDEAMLRSAGASILLPGVRSNTFLAPFQAGGGWGSDGDRTPLTARLQPAGASFFYLRYEQDPNNADANVYSAPNSDPNAPTPLNGPQTHATAGNRGRYAYRSDSQFLNAEESYLHAKHEDDDKPDVTPTTTRGFHRSLNARGRSLRDRIAKVRDQYRRSLKHHAKEVAHGTIVCVSEVMSKSANGCLDGSESVSPMLRSTAVSPGGVTPRGAQGRLPGKVCFDQLNITVQRYDTVRFRWCDPYERIIETTSDFFQEFPGGMHSPPVTIDQDVSPMMRVESTAADIEAVQQTDAPPMPPSTVVKRVSLLPESSTGTSSGSGEEHTADVKKKKDPKTAAMEMRQTTQLSDDTVAGLGATVAQPPSPSGAAGSGGHGDGTPDGEVRAMPTLGGPVYKMHYNLVFADAGDYYFVCTRDHRSMRVHVQVRAAEPIWWLKYLIIGLVALIVLLAIALVSFGVSYAVTKHGILSDFITPEANNTLQKDSLKRVDALLTRRLLPWIAVGVLMLLVTIIAWAATTKCCQRQPSEPSKHMPSTFRGYVLHTRKAWAIATIVATFVCFALSIGIWGALLTAVYDTGTMVDTLVNAIYDTVHTFQGAITDAESLVGALPGVLSPTVDIPYADINSTLLNLDNLLVDINGWVSFVANLVLACMRALPFLSFLMLQITIIASIYGILGGIFRHSHSTQLAVWLCLLSMGCVAIGAGFYWCVYGALDILELLISSFTYQNDTTGAEWAARVMFPSNSPLASVYDACIPGGVLSTVSVVGVLNDTVNTIYDSLDETERNDYKELFDIADALTNASGELYDNYFYWVAAQAEQMQAYMNEVGDDSGLKAAAPLISSGISIAMTLATALNCDVFRDIFAEILPLLRAGMIDTLHALYALYITLFAFLFVTIIVVAMATFVLCHPRMNWYHFRSKRWFRLHWSYRTHQELLERGGARGLDAYQEEEYRRSSTMRHLQKCRHAAMFLSLLLFVDGIVMAILSRFNNKNGLLIAGPFLLYAQCILFSFGYVLVNYRFLLEQVCTLGSCVCLVVYVVTQIVVGVIKLVDFANCVTHKRTEQPEATALYPVKLTCPPLTMAIHLEEAVYPILTALVAIAIVVLQLFMLLHPTQLHRLWQDLRSLRVSRDVLRISVKARRRRWIAWVVISVLMLALLLGLVLSHASPISLTTNTNRTDDNDYTIVNVVDPTIGCNGNRAYCDKTFHDLVWLAAHNAYSSQDLNYVTPNHYWKMDLQLKAGIRVFLIDLWYDKVDPNNASSPQDVYLCHSICTIGRELMETALAPLVTFLATYPEEVVILDLEQYVSTPDVGRVLGALDLLKYTWTSNNTPVDNVSFVWPTLGEYVASGQRLLVFGSEENYTMPDHPAWMLPRSYYRYETAWTTYQPDQFRCNIYVYWCSTMPNPNFTDYSTYNESGFANCSSSTLGVYKNESYLDFMSEHHALPPVMDRKLALINAMVTIGVAIPSSAAQVNQPNILSALTGRCSQTWARVPNIVAVDYWNVGNGLQQVATMNNLILKYGTATWQNHLGIPLYTEYQGAS